MPRAFLVKKSVHEEEPSFAAMELAFPMKTGNPLRDMKSHPANLSYFPSPNTPWPPIGLPTAGLTAAHDHLFPRQPLATKNPETLWMNNNFPPFSTTTYISCHPSHAAPHWTTAGSPFRPYHNFPTGISASPPPFAHLYAAVARHAQNLPKPKSLNGGTPFDIDSILGNPGKKVRFEVEEKKMSDDDEEEVEPMETESLKSRLGRKLCGKSQPRYQCCECKKSYSTVSGLTKHQEFHCNMLHEQTYRCRFCDKNYGTQGALKMHSRTHTLPNQCTVCGRRFSRPWLLQGHMRTHSGEKPYTCQQCHRPFADKSNLRAHLQTHADIKKYKCQICLKTFSRMSLLNKHQSGSCRPGSSTSTTHNLEGTLV